LDDDVVFSFEYELAKTLGDCFLRRTMRGLNGDLGLGDLEAAAEIGTRLLGWSEERAKREVENYRKEISKSHPQITQITQIVSV
jgi:glycerol-3-phosphate dehydrogenase